MPTITLIDNEGNRLELAPGWCFVMSGDGPFLRKEEHRIELNPSFQTNRPNLTAEELRQIKTAHDAIEA